MNLRTLSAALAAYLCAGLAGAQDYPNKPVRIVVPWPVGGVTDIGARILAEKLTENLGKSFVVDNKPGANGFIGTELVAKAAPDGYTLLFVSTTTHAVAPALYRKLPYDPIKDFEAVSQVTFAPTIAVSPATSPYKTLADLVAAAKANPGKLNYATYGAGGSSQLAATLFMQAAGIEMTAIPYKGATPAVTGLMSGETDVFFDSIPSSLSHVKSGRLKALAVTGLERVPAAPEIPTLAETYPGVVYTVWQGVEAPAGTPKAVVDKLHAEILRVTNSPDVREKMLKLGAIAVGSPTPADFARHIATEKDKLAALIKRAGIPFLD